VTATSRRGVAVAIATGLIVAATVAAATLGGAATGVVLGIGALGSLCTLVEADRFSMSGNGVATVDSFELVSGLIEAVLAPRRMPPRKTGAPIAQAMAVSFLFMSSRFSFWRRAWSRACDLLVARRQLSRPQGQVSSKFRGAQRTAALRSIFCSAGVGGPLLQLGDDLACRHNLCDSGCSTNIQAATVDGRGHSRWRHICEGGHRGRVEASNPKRLFQGRTKAKPHSAIPS
jgi:hypothetical protein